jgi:hypothetical protein
VLLVRLVSTTVAYREPAAASRLWSPALRSAVWQRSGPVGVVGGTGAGAPAVRSVEVGVGVGGPVAGVVAPGVLRIGPVAVESVLRPSQAAAPSRRARLAAAVRGRRRAVRTMVGVI